MKDIVAGTILFLFSLVMYWRATLIRNPGFDQLGPAFTPKLILMLLGLLSLGLIIAGFIERRRAAQIQPPEETQPQTADPCGLQHQVGVVVALFLYVVALSSQRVSFELASLLFTLVTGALLMPRTRKAAVTLLITSLVVIFGVSYIFRNILFVALP